MDYEDNTLKRIARGVGIFSIGLILSKFLAYAYRLITARLGVENYGLLSIALAVFGICVTLSILGMSDGVIRFASFYKGKGDERRIKGVITSAIKFTLPLSLICGIVLFLISDWIAITFFHDIRLSLLLKIISFGVPFDVLRSLFFSAIKAFQRVEYEIWGKIVAENLTKVSLTLIFVYLGFGILWATIAYLISIIVSFVFSMFFLEKKVFSIFKTRLISITSNKELLSYSLPLLFTSFIFLIIQWTDTLMLGGFKTSIEVGLYNVALPTATLLHLFPSAVRTLFMPVLSEVYAKGRKKAFKLSYITVVKWIIIINSLVFLYLVVFSEKIISFLFGPEYILKRITLFGLNLPLTSFALIILCMGMIPGEFLTPSKDLLMVLKKTKLIFLNTIIGAFSNIFLNYLLIPSYGIIGAAIASASSYIIITILVYFQSYKYSKIHPFNFSSIKVWLVAFVFSFLVTLFKLNKGKISEISIVMIFIGCFYFILLLFLKVFNKEDLNILESILRKLKININLRKYLRKFI